jgi:hypothetical protein
MLLMVVADKGKPTDSNGMTRPRIPDRASVTTRFHIPMLRTLGNATHSPSLLCIYTGV